MNVTIGENKSLQFSSILQEHHWNNVDGGVPFITIKLIGMSVEQYVPFLMSGPFAREVCFDGRRSVICKLP